MGLSHPLLLPLQIPWQGAEDHICKLQVQILDLSVPQTYYVYTGSCRSSKSGCKDSLTKSSSHPGASFAQNATSPLKYHTHCLTVYCSTASDAFIEMLTTTPMPIFLHWQVELTWRRRKKRYRKMTVCCQHCLQKHSAWNVCLHHNQMHLPSFVFRDLLHFHFQWYNWDSEKI